MRSDTAVARAVVLEYLQAHGQASTQELVEAIAQALGDDYSEGKAAGAIRMCVENGRYHVVRRGRGMYAYQPEAAKKPLAAKPIAPPAVCVSPQTAAQKAEVDRVMQEALAQAKEYISAQLDLYALSPEAFVYASRIIDQLNRAIVGR